MCPTELGPPGLVHHRQQRVARVEGHLRRRVARQQFLEGGDVVVAADDVLQARRQPALAGGRDLVVEARVDELARLGVGPAEVHAETHGEPEVDGNVAVAHVPMLGNRRDRRPDSTPVGREERRRVVATVARRRGQDMSSRSYISHDGTIGSFSC